MSVKSRRSRTKKNAHRYAVSEVRIIGGKFKRQLVPFIDAEGLRPSPDRLRETLFNWIQFELYDVSVLDLCAGSGVLGLEALSRGAQYVTFIELQSAQAQLIADTAKRLKVPDEQYDILTGDARRMIPGIGNKSIEGKYHLVFIDPPYDLDLWAPLLTSLIQNKLIDTTTLLYIEDRRPLAETLAAFQTRYTTLKETKIGQVFASLIQLEL